MPAPAPVPVPRPCSVPSLSLSLSPSLSPRLTLTPTLTLALALTSSEWSPGTGWLTDAKAGLALEMSQVMGPGFKIDGVLDDVDSVLLFAVGSGISPIRSGMP